MVKHPLAQAELSDRFAYAVGVAMGARVDETISQKEQEALENLLAALELPEDQLDRVQSSSAVANDASIDSVLSVLTERYTKLLFMLDLYTMALSDAELTDSEREMGELFADLLDLCPLERQFLIGFAQAARQSDTQAAKACLSQVFDAGLDLPTPMLLHFLPTLDYCQEIFSFSVEKGERKSITRTCRIHGPVTVNSGGVLEISEGVHVYMGKGAVFLIKGGQLHISGCRFIAEEGSETTLIKVTDVPRIQWEQVTFACSNRGRAMQITGGTVSLSDCLFSDCAAIEPDNGGAIYAESAQLILERCSFSHCFAKNCGGALYVYNAIMTLNGCSFSAIQGDRDGGAVYSWSSPTEMNDCSFKQCITRNAGGALYYSCTNLSMTNCTYTDCQSFKNGGAICFDGSYSVNRFNAERCAFTNCESKQNGGAITMEHVTYSFESLSFATCSASKRGGAIFKGEYDDKAASKITCCAFSNCVAAEGIDVGGALDINSNSYRPTIDQCQYTDCRPVDCKLR